MARHGEATGIEYGEYYLAKVDFENQIRQKLFGSSNLAELGVEWGLIKDKNNGKNNKD